MNLNEHERPRPSLAGRVSPVQQAEMKLLLAGGWPPLKPLPVFKYETDAYRVSIDFDKLRGEWVCRKTSLPSNKAQELRGGLREIIRALPNGPAEVFAACSAVGRQEHELDKDVSRRVQAIFEWKEHYESGALYSGLRNYLSESQQQEVEEILRLTLTARQLQFTAKNVSNVFEALSKAGGKLAMLIEIARRNKMQEADSPAKAETTAPIAERDVPAEDLIPSTLENLSEAPLKSIFPEQVQLASPEWVEVTPPQAPEILRPGIQDANPPSFVEDIQQEVQPEAPVALEPQFRTRKAASSPHRIENSPSRSYVVEISGVHIAAFAVVFLFAMISLPIGLTVGRGPLGQWLRDAGKSILAENAPSPAQPDRPAEVAPRNTSTPPAGNPLLDSGSSPGANKLVDAALSEEKLTANPRGSESVAKTPATNSNPSPAFESKPSIGPGPAAGGNHSAGAIARNTPPSASPKFAPSSDALGPVNAAPANTAPRGVAPSMGAAMHQLTPSTILVTPPARGSKPFRVTFAEKPIAATSSIAIASELSVLVPPQRGLSAAHRPARLQAGELVSFVWPRYSWPGDRYASAETVKVRSTIGLSGQVLDVKLVSGSASMLPATISAIRHWHYRPTLLNKRPVQVQQDVTIEFRPPQHLSQARTQHPPHN